MTAKGFKIDTSSPVLVTGATGYIAGVLIRDLLQKGVTVHGTVRDPSQTDRLQYLKDLADESTSTGSLKFFQGDLTDPGSFAEGMKGCSIVFHTASPFAMKVDDPQKDLVDPAVQGTRNVLNQATKTPSVKRVVVTSSIGAIITDASDSSKAPNQTVTEDVWNMTASLDYQPYFFSKTMAEHAAWEVAGSQTQWTLVTINPSFVMGPGLKYHASSESFTTIKALGGGEMGPIIPRFGVALVDVRDVAQAHTAVAFNDSAKGRFIISGHNTDFPTMAETLRVKYAEEYPTIPSKVMPKTLFKIMGPLIPGAGLSRRYIVNNVDHPMNFDTTKSQTELGMEYRSMDVTLQEMFQQLIDAGALKKDEANKK